MSSRLPESLQALADSVLWPGFVGRTPPDWLRRRLGEGLGGVMLFARNVESPDQVRRLTAALHAENPHAIVSVDEEGGDVTRLEAATGSSFPGNLALGTVDDEDLTTRVAAALGRMLSDVGIDLTLGPVADVNVNPANPVIGVRSFGSDPKTVAAHTGAWVRGCQSTGVAACLKHFPGHGDTAVDSHLALPAVHLTDEEIEAVHLPPFVAGIAAGAQAVMTAHLLVPAYDVVPATISRVVLTDLLRRRLGFDGVIVTDGLEMRAISATVGIAEGAVLALAAGADALCIGGGMADEATATTVRDAIVAAVSDGRLSEERLADAAARVAGLASWRDNARRSGPPDEGSVLDGRRAAREAAGRALRISGDVALSGVDANSPVVIQLETESNVAVGSVPWGPGPQLASRIRDTLTIRVPGPADDVDERLDMALFSAQGAPLVFVVRDAGRRQWVRRAVARALVARPDLVVVDMGLPATEQLAPAQIETYGAARVLSEAVAERLLGEVL